MKPKEKLPVLTHPQQKEDELKKLGVSLCAILDTVRQRKDNTYTIRIRIIYNRFPKLYSTKLNLTTEDYLKMIGQKPGKDFKNKRRIVHELLQDAYNVLINMNSFSFESFDKKFLNKKGDWLNVFFAFNTHIKDLEENGQISTASTYITAQRSFKLFHKKKVLIFDEVSPKFLNKYESYMNKEDRSPTTISINTRCLRRLYNLAINQGDAKRELYPFGKKENGLYEVPAAQNIKKALSKADIKKLFDYKPELHSPEHFYRDIFLFSYLCNGMNPADIFRLKYKNLHDGQIIFIRKKIAHKRSLKPIQIEISSEIQNIIDKWGQKPVHPDKHIYNILTNDLSPEIELARVKQGTAMINKYIKRIATKVGINESLSTIWARHSFASVLKLSGEDVSYISEAMGHSNLKTTDNYLSSFDREKRREAGKKLTDFD